MTVDEDKGDNRRFLIFPTFLSVAFAKVTRKVHPEADVKIKKNTSILNLMHGDREGAIGRKSIIVDVTRAHPIYSSTLSVACSSEGPILLRCGFLHDGSVLLRYLPPPPKKIPRID